MKLLKTGATRWVLLTNKYAFKFPNCWSYRNFLQGLLANMQERQFSKVDIMKEKLCPILFYVPGGFLVVMTRCERLDRVYTEYELDSFLYCGVDWKIPAETKQDSFGLLNGSMVCLDYGS